MAYADIERKIHELLNGALDDDISVTRGYHSPNQLKSVAVRPGSAAREQSGPRGRLNRWTIEVAIQISSGLDLSEFHDDVLSIRQTAIDTLDGYPTLDQMQGVTACMVTSISEPQNSTEGRVHTFSQVLFVQVLEHTTVTGGEYA